MNNNEDLSKINNSKRMTDEMKNEIKIPPFLTQKERINWRQIALSVVALAVPVFMTVIVYRKK